MAVELGTVQTWLKEGLPLHRTQILVLPEDPIDERPFKMPAILWVDPFVRIDDNQPVAFKIKAAGIEGCIYGPVQEANIRQKRWSLHGREGYAHVKQGLRQTEFWFDKPENGNLMEAHPLFAGLLSVIDWRGLPIVRGFAGEQQYYLNSGRTPLWEFFMTYVSSPMLKKLVHTYDPNMLKELQKAQTGIANVITNGSVNGTVNGALTKG